MRSRSGYACGRRLNTDPLRRLKSDPRGVGPVVVRSGLDPRLIVVIGEEEGVWSGWSSGRRSGACMSSGCRSGRSASGPVFIAGRSAGRWRRRCRRGMCGRRRGRSWDPFQEWICEQLRADPLIQSLRLREMAVELGYVGGKTIFDDYVREVRPRFARPRSFQRTIYRPGELVQCDLGSRGLSFRSVTGSCAAVGS